MWPNLKLGGGELDWIDPSVPVWFAVCCTVQWNKPETSASGSRSWVPNKRYLDMTVIPKPQCLQYPDTSGALTVLPKLGKVQLIQMCLGFYILSRLCILWTQHVRFFSCDGSGGIGWMQVYFLHTTVKLQLCQCNHSWRPTAGNTL